MKRLFQLSVLFGLSLVLGASGLLGQGVSPNLSLPLPADPVGLQDITSLDSILSGNSTKTISTWSKTKTYAAGNTVVYQGLVYTSLAGSNTNNIPLTATTFWGAPGTGGGAPLAALPGTPNVVYTFVAAGDQTGVVVHDISGNHNDGTMNAPSAPPWTGTGFSFNGQAASNALFTPVLSGTNQTHCMSYNAPYYGVVGSQNVNSQLMLSNGGGRGWYITDNGGQTPGYGSQAWQDVVNAGGGTTLTSLPQDTGFHTRCLVLRSGLSDRIFVDGVETTYANQSSTSFSTSLTWSLIFVTGGNNTTTLYYYAEWSSVLPDAQIQQASLAMTQAVASRGVPVTNPTNLLNKAGVYAVGDSITCCGGSGSSWYPAIESVSSVYGTPVNEGFPGAPVLTFAEAIKQRDVPHCYSGSQPSVVTIFGGTNDGLFSATVQNTFNYTMYAVNALRQAGCQVGVATMLSRTALDTFKNQLNPLIRAGAGPNTYFLIDTANSPSLGCDGCFSNATFFSGDNVHPNQTGQNLLGASFSNAINAYGIGSATLGNPTAYSATSNTMVSADRFATMNNASATATTLPDCLGVTGTTYQIANLGAGTVTFSGKASEAITGSTTLAQNGVGIFAAQLISQAAAGCGWLRVQ